MSENQTQVKAPTNAENAKAIESLKGNVSDLSNKMDQILALFAKQAEEAPKKEAVIAAQPVATPKVEPIQTIKISATDDITFVHLVQRAEGLATLIELSTLSLRLTVLGETFTLSRQQADEFIGRYRTWFDEGIFAVGNDPISIQYATSKRLKMASDYIYSNMSFSGLGDLSLDGIEQIYNSVAPAHQKNIIECFKRKWIESQQDGANVDSRFADIHKLELLNRLDPGCCKYEINAYTDKQARPDR